MRKFIMIPIVAIAVAAAIPALAGDDDIACERSGGKEISVEEATAAVAGMGYKVRGVEREGGCYEVKAIDGNGGRIELTLDPVTGKVIGSHGRS